MMKKHNLGKKFLALLLVLVMTLGYLPVMTDAAELEISNKVADPETLNNWQGYYGDSSLLPDGSTGISTWKAGGVWTDKSVFANNTDITAAGLPTSLADPNAFLVSLSALASTQEIVGQSSTPTDTMLVLDVSGSMDDNDKAEGMVEAANRAIDALLKQNVNNRVGVLLYSGTRTDNGATATTLLLPLDHYTTTSTVNAGSWYRPENIPAYLTISDSNSSPNVGIASGVLNSLKNRPTSAERRVVGATYIQRGLYDAWKEFEEVEDIKVPQGNVQAGVQRSPVIILMSDGRPTLATDVYNNVALRNSDYGNGTEDSTSWETVFLTQLTAAWVKGAVADHYGTDAMFYTMGLGTGNDTFATGVLNPSSTTNNNVHTWWSNFQSGTNANGSVLVEDNWGTSNDWYLTYDGDRFATGIGRNYTDGYWSASSVSDMISKFQEIVAEIGLQSAYTATLVESGEADLDGYITVQDELGSMMEVKNVKGILLGNTLFTGAEFAKSMNEGDLGSNADNATDYGNEFIRTVKERLNIETSTAQQLVNAAYMDGQLSYTNNSTYSNYLGWYGDENNAYLGFWDKDSGMTSVGAPAGTKYINRSYLYLGEAQASDMMHVIVMVRTEIANGHQTVRFRVPASLIPMVRYKVELEGNSLEEATDITLTVEETDPIRLLYEVGLPDDVNEVNLEQKVAEYLAKDGSNHIHKNADGSYTFYANSWGAEHDVAPDIANMSDEEKLALTEKVAESHFIPNTANERFYIQEDALIYTYNGGSYVKATSQPVAGTDYYFVRTIVNVTGANGKAEAAQQYEKLYAATVANASNFTQNDDGDWVVKAGTVRQTLSTVGLPKASNETGTIANSDHLWVDITGNTARDHHIYNFLGNNGKLTVMPTSGIKVTKDVTELADGQSADEKFPIVVTLSQASDDLQITDAEGNALPTEAYNVNGNVITLYLADGETAYVSGLTVGTTYTVTEEHSKYTPSYIYENADKTVRAGYIDGVTVTNAPVKNGSLYITKEVVHAHEGETIPTGYEFDFRVTFLDANGEPIANKAFDIVNNHDGDLTRSTDANGVMTGKLCHGETAHILGIPAGATVTVEEVNLPADGNYTLTGYRSRNASGQDADNDGVVTIVSEANATVVVTNTYTPKSTTVDLDIPVTKTFIAESVPTEVITFIFEVQQWNGTAWESITRPNGNDVVCYMNFWDNYTVVGENVINATFENALEGITYTQAGVYAYQVIEKIPSDEDRVPGLVYDRTLWTFTVTVTDVNGELKATVTDLNNQPITDGSYEVSFVNQSHAATVNIDIQKQVDDKSGNPLVSKAGFEFVAQTAVMDNAGNLHVKPESEGGRTFPVFSDAAGEARMTDVYKAPGEYYYIISEKSDGKPGWTYDDTQYWVKVVVLRDNTGDLSASMVVMAVDGEGNRTEYQTSGTSTSLSFKNTYAPAEAEVSLETLADKKLTGRDLVKGEFEFAIYPNGQTTGAVATGTNDTEGNVIFTSEKLSFSKIGKYEYDVVEIDNGLGGVVYDGITYDLVIEVTDAGDGTLTATYYFEDSTETTVVFNNTYTATPTEVVIEGQKTLRVQSGQKDLTAGMFTFGLYENDVKIAETANLANGSFLFEAITYQAPGTYTYTVKEIAPDGTTDGSYSANGQSYTGDTFTVTVDVVDNGEGALIANVSGNGTGNIHFINTYASSPASVTLMATKILENRQLTDGEFRYAIYATDASFGARTLVNDQITNDAQGQIVFNLGNMGMGYHYFVLKEVIPEERAAGISYDASEYHITVQVTDGGNGQMNAVTTVHHTGDPNVINPDIVFKNIYRPADSELILSGSKELTGGKPLAAGDYTFSLLENGNVLDQAEVAVDGSFSFETIVYTADDIGQHTYTVKEDIPAGAVQNADGSWSLGTITYDATEYTVVVTVSDDDQDGALEISKTVNGDANKAITFTNVHTPNPVALNLEAQKEYNKTLEAGQFTFTLEGEGFANQEKTNDANGKVTFDPLQLTEAKTYTFTVREKEEILWGFIQWDKSEYVITVTVENVDGELKITGQTVTVNAQAKDGAIVFSNKYVMEDEKQIVLSGVKQLTGDRTTVKAGEFEFGLYDASGALIERVKNDASGNFTFSALKFDESHTQVDGKSDYIYTVKEIAGTNNGMTYDDTVYTVKVTVQDNNAGGIDVSHTITADGQEAEIAFANTYTITGSGSVEITGTKTYDGKTLQGDDFVFVLSKDGNELEQVKNAADGTFAFASINYTKADIGVHTYTVSEQRPADAQQLEDGSYMKDGTIYDANIYTVEVTVADDGNGGLSITKTVNNLDAEEISVVFDNTYEIFGTGKLELEGTKELTGGKQLTDGAFAFGLYEGDKLIAQAENQDGVFQLVKAYTADELGTYTYTVKEILPEGAVKNDDGTWSLDGVTYDPTVYTVEVVVEDDQKGGIAVTSDLINAEQIAFENAYTPDDKIITIDVQKILDNKTDEQISLEGFEFEISCGQNVQTAKSDASGKTCFEVTFTAQHIGQSYTFKVSEKNAGVKGMTYDKTVHTITVQVLQNEDGTLKTVINDKTADQASVSFTNVYEELVVPPLGDDFNLILPIVLMVLSALGMVAVISLRKRKEA